VDRAGPAGCHAVTLGDKARFVQIAVAMAPQQANLIYALDDSGAVWCYRDTKKRWMRVPEDREE